MTNQQGLTQSPWLGPGLSKILRLFVCLSGRSPTHKIFEISASWIFYGYMLILLAQ